MQDTLDRTMKYEWPAERSKLLMITITNTKQAAGVSDIVFQRLHCFPQQNDKTTTSTSVIQLQHTFSLFLRKEGDCSSQYFHLFFFFVKAKLNNFCQQKFGGWITQFLPDEILRFSKNLKLILLMKQSKKKKGGQNTVLLPHPTEKKTNK